jgi:LysM repeat protein
MCATWRRRSWLLTGVLAGLLAAGCSPWLDNSREDDHPLINEAVARKAISPREASRLLEKALEANPRLARAHWELALISLNNTSNHAAAVYHFQKVLALRPDWPHANTATQLISQAKLELVKEGIEPPTLPSAQRQIDRYVGEIHRLNGALTNLQEQVRSLTVITQQLNGQNLQLRQQLLASAQALAARSAPAVAPPAPGPAQPAPLPLTTRGSDTLGAARTNPAPVTPPASRATYRGSVANNAAAGGSSPRVTPPDTYRTSGRTHTFRPGETAFSVAKRYHLTVRDLMRANPGLDPGKVKAGQTIRLP